MRAKDEPAAVSLRSTSLSVSQYRKAEQRQRVVWLGTVRQLTAAATPSKAPMKL